MSLSVTNDGVLEYIVDALALAIYGSPKGSPPAVSSKVNVRGESVLRICS